MAKFFCEGPDYQYFKICSAYDFSPKCSHLTLPHESSHKKHIMKKCGYFTVNFMNTEIEFYIILWLTEYYSSSDMFRLF